jgi:Fuc2NAc and GlcNAc transferase
VIVLGITFLLAAVLCGFYLRFARRMQILDQPNDRSSHTRATPHGGGAPLLLGFALGMALATLLYGPWPAIYQLLALLALLLCALGVVDDLHGLSKALRFSAYGLACATVAALLLQGLGEVNTLLYGMLVIVCALAMLWAVNLYNFMDGIDGFAAIQCFLATAGMALLAWFRGADPAYPLFCLLLGVSHMGFLIWNWPPARLFMGDAGSIPTGFLLVSLALLGHVSGALPIACWLILLAVFITDASWTLLWRMATGQRFTEAHRLHAYQRLSRHWGSHLSVDMLLLAINGLWLFPLAAAAAQWPAWQPVLVIMAFLPLVSAMAILKKLA